MFTDTQIKELSAKLEKSNVKTRSQSGQNLSYIEGWHAINEANRIFGFDQWSRETVYCHEVCRYEKKSSSNSGMNWKVGYEAKVRVTVDGVTREGTGHGNGTMTDLYDCIESAAKEAETDAMKRALMTFGNPFGLALYDKTRENVADPAAEAAQAEKEKSDAERTRLKPLITAIERAIKEADSLKTLEAISKLHSQTLIDFKNFNEAAFDALMGKITKRQTDLTNQKAA